MKIENTKHPKKTMVYMFAFRLHEDQFIYGSGGYTKELFKPKTYEYLQSAIRQYTKLIQPANNKDTVTIDSIHLLAEQQRDIYLDFLLRSRPACLAFALQDFHQILNEWLIYPDAFTEVMESGLKDSKKVAMDVRKGFIESFRLFDIGKDMKSMLNYYQSGMLTRLQ